MEPAEEPVHDWQHNVLRDRLDAAADRADQAVAAIGPRGTNPMADVVARLADAWVAERSPVRDAFGQDLLGVGAAIRSAFVTGAQQLRSAQFAEPYTIDVAQHPELEWKTSGSRIDSRVWAYSRGYR